MTASPEFLRPRLRFFVSADIVGSTALKQSRLGAFGDPTSAEGSSWFAVIQGFYIEAQQSFLSEWEKTAALAAGTPELIGEPPRLWKTIGDEVLFVKTLTDYRQLAVTLKCWIEAVKYLKSFVKDRDSRLDVKCCAWIAGFPLKNKEVVLDIATSTGQPVEDYFLENGRLLNLFYEKKLDQLSIDYIGPSIDTGFRIATQATSRKFVLSVEIPFILSLTNPSQDGVIGDFDIFYEGSIPLKGVLGGVDYPIFWIDMSDRDTLPSFEDKLTGASPPGRDAVRRYCESFYKEHAAYTFRPFIESGTEQQISSKPDWYERAHANLVKNFEQAEPAEPVDDSGGGGGGTGTTETPTLDVSDLLAMLASFKLDQPSTE